MPVDAYSKRILAYALTARIAVSIQYSIQPAVTGKTGAAVVHSGG